MGIWNPPAGGFGRIISPNGFRSNPFFDRRQEEDLKQKSFLGKNFLRRRSGIIHISQPLDAWAQLWLTRQTVKIHEFEPNSIRTRYH